MISRKKFRLMLQSGRLLLGERTLVMGVLNVTPDSFSDGGNFLQPSVGAWVSGSLGYNAMFVLYAAMYVVAASMWLFIDPDRPFHDEETGPTAHGRSALAS